MKREDKAHVHVVIIGLGAFDTANKRLYDYETKQITVIDALNISPYLTPGPDLFVTKRSKPLCDVPAMRCGSKPTDDGNFILTDEEKEECLNTEPGAAKFLRRFTGSEEFINGNMRWCLWLAEASPADVRSLPRVMERVGKVKEFREKSTAEPTKKAATTPTLFFYISQPATDYILILEVSSERRQYVPMGFMSKDVISANTNFLVASNNFFHFGILTSAMHMAWLRVVGGRLSPITGIQVAWFTTISLGRMRVRSSGSGWKKRRERCWQRASRICRPKEWPRWRICMIR